MHVNCHVDNIDCELNHYHCVTIVQYHCWVKRDYKFSHVHLTSAYYNFIQYFFSTKRKTTTMNQQETISMMTIAEEQQYDEQSQVVPERFPLEHHNKLTDLQRQHAGVDDNVNRVRLYAYMHRIS